MLVIEVFTGHKPEPSDYFENCNLFKKESEKPDTVTDDEDDIVMSPDLESEEEAEKRQKEYGAKKIEELIKIGKESVEKIEKLLKNEKNNNNNKEYSTKGLKIMTPNQLITRLPILLAQKQTG